MKMLLNGKSLSSLVWCFNDEAGDGAGGGGASEGVDDGAPTSIQVGEKTYTAEQIKELEQAAFVGSSVIERAQRYNIEPGQYLSYSDGALNVAAELRTQGLLSDDGELKLPQAQTPASVPAAAAAKAVPSAKDDVLTKLSTRVQQLEKQNAELYRQRVESVVKGVDARFTNEDVLIVAREALRTKRPVEEVAKARANTLGSREALIREDERKKMAEEYHLDLGKLNRIKEIGPDGPSVTSIVGSKKLSMKPGKDSVTPKQALTEFLSQRDAVS